MAHDCRPKSEFEKLNNIGSLKVIIDKLCIKSLRLLTNWKEVTKSTEISRAGFVAAHVCGHIFLFHHKE